MPRRLKRGHFALARPKKAEAVTVADGEIDMIERDTVAVSRGSPASMVRLDNLVRSHGGPTLSVNPQDSA
jgi:hypothetical protein